MEATLRGGEEGGPDGGSAFARVGSQQCDPGTNEVYGEDEAVTPVQIAVAPRAGSRVWPRKIPDGPVVKTSPFQCRE